MSNFASHRHDHIRCGFCRKRASEDSDIFISGVETNICESCVRDAVCIISQKRRNNPPKDPVPPRVA